MALAGAETTGAATMAATEPWDPVGAELPLAGGVVGCPVVEVALRLAWVAEVAARLVDVLERVELANVGAAVGADDDGDGADDDGDGDDGDGDGDVDGGPEPGTITDAVEVLGSPEPGEVTDLVEVLGGPEPGTIVGEAVVVVAAGAVVVDPGLGEVGGELPVGTGALTPGALAVVVLPAWGRVVDEGGRVLELGSVLEVVAAGAVVTAGTEVVVVAVGGAVVVVPGTVVVVVVVAASVVGAVLVVVVEGGRLAVVVLALGPAATVVAVVERRPPASVTAIVVVLAEPAPAAFGAEMTAGNARNEAVSRPKEPSQARLGWTSLRLRLWKKAIRHLRRSNVMPASAAHRPARH
ncbi:MAG: hypothetical protein ACRDZX_03100 [Acidimicrobiales bacterium]